MIDGLITPVSKNEYSPRLGQEAVKEQGEFDGALDGEMNRSGVDEKEQLEVGSNKPKPVRKKETSKKEDEEGVESSVGPEVEADALPLDAPEEPSQPGGTSFLKSLLEGAVGTSVKKVPGLLGKTTQGKAPEGTGPLPELSIAELESSVAELEVAIAELESLEGGLQGQLTDSNVAKLKVFTGILHKVIARVEKKDVLPLGAVKQLFNKIENSLKRFMGKIPTKGLMTELKSLLTSPELKQVLELPELKGVFKKVSEFLTKVAEQQVGEGELLDKGPVNNKKSQVVVSKPASENSKANTGQSGRMASSGEGFEKSLAKQGIEQEAPVLKKTVEVQTGVKRGIPRSVKGAKPTVVTRNAATLKGAGVEVSKSVPTHAKEIQDQPLRVKGDVTLKADAMTEGLKGAVTEDVAKLVKGAKVEVKQGGAGLTKPLYAPSKFPVPEESTSDKQESKGSKDSGAFSSQQKQLGMKVLKRMKQILTQQKGDSFAFESVQSKMAQARSVATPVQRAFGGNMLNQVVGRIQAMINSQSMVSGSLEFSTLDFGDMKLAAEIQGGKLSVSFSGMSQQVRAELIAMRQDLQDELKVLGFEDVDLGFGFDQQGSGGQAFEEEMAEKRQKAGVKLVGDQAADITRISEWLEDFEKSL